MTTSSFNLNDSLNLDDSITFDSSEFLSSTLNDDIDCAYQTPYDEDSGISSDNSFIENSDFLSVSVSPLKGPIDFSSMVTKQSISPLLSNAYQGCLEPSENSATMSLEDSFWFSAKSIPKKEPKTPFRDISNNTSSLCASNFNDNLSPISSKFRRIDLNQGVKRGSSTISSNPYDFESPKRFRQNPSTSNGQSSLHRASSTVELGKHHTQLVSDSPDNNKHYRLPGVNRHKTDLSFRRIENQTLVDLIEEHGQNFNDNYILIDCRYPFEYDGGHILHAINLYDPDDLYRMFYPMEASDFAAINKKTPIFYCEYSSVRGPNMANALRKFDRLRNQHLWPALDFNEIYVLSDGYQNFFKSLPTDNKFCVPPTYTSMHDSAYSKELQKFKFHKKSSSLRPSSSRNLFKRTKSMFESSDRS